jgi:hypothetical protein
VKKRMRLSNLFKTAFFKENKNNFEAQLDNKRMKITMFNTKMNTLIPLSNNKIFYLRHMVIFQFRTNQKSQILIFSQIYN